MGLDHVELAPAKWSFDITKPALDGGHKFTIHENCRD